MAQLCYQAIDLDRKLGSSLGAGSFAMPGSVIEDEAVLMEHTQAPW